MKQVRTIESVLLVLAASLSYGCATQLAPKQEEQGGYTADSQPAGFLAKPAPGIGPGVLVLHAWWGLNDNTKAICTQLADSGFVAFAPDLYQGKVANSIADAKVLLSALNANPQKAVDEIAEAALFLTEQSEISDRGLAVLGFSLGASYALDLAASYSDRVDSVILFYGTGGGDFSNSRASFLGHFAENDEFEPQSAVDELMESLKSQNRPVVFYTYPDVGHWFFESDRPESYDEAAASLAWERTISFLRGRATH